jgi:HEPN domain-containing protein
MHNKNLVKDHIRRAGKRLLAVELLFREQSWADVVRESQEVVELCLKALLRACGVEVPRVHDVSSALDQERARLPKKLQPSADFLIEASKTLRRDRELAFYGSEDLTPSEFYSESDAREALQLAAKTHQLVKDAIGE